MIGPNGVGKSNLLEAVGYLALLESFRGAPTEAWCAPAATVRSCAAACVPMP